MLTVTDKTVFRFEDRGYNATWLVLPGWAMTADYFRRIELPFNWVSVESLNMTSFLDDFSDYLARSTHTISGCLAVSLAGRWLWSIQEQLPLERIVYWGVRPEFPSSDLDLACRFLAKSRSGYVRSFFKQALAGSGSQIDDFRRLMAASEHWSNEALEMGLAALRKPMPLQSRRHPESVWFIHGENDRIAPLNELLFFLEQLGLQDRLQCMDNVGHLWAGSAKHQVHTFFDRLLSD